MNQNKLASLLSAQSLSKISMEDLEELVNKHPYFPVGQFLLAKKMKQEKHSGYLPQAQKAAVYFTNTLWLQYQLLQEDVVDKKESEAEVSAAEQELNKEEVAEEIVEAILPEEITERPIETEVVVEEIIIPEEITAAPLEEIEIDEDELPVEDNQEPVSEQPSLPKLAEMLKEQAADFKKPVDEAAKLPSETEPYHTVDYFASQGIKLSQEAQDRLTIKVRRFTDWLKQMKSINPKPADLGTDPEMEHKVQDNAASSNEPKEVVTETMAEVLIKQGKIDQAIQLYIKLSFLDPHKSAYFAAQIENLKGL